MEVAAHAASFLGLGVHQIALSASQILTDADRLGSDGHVAGNFAQHPHIDRAE